VIAEVPNAIFVPAHPNRFRQRPAAPVGQSQYDLVVVHITSGHAEALGCASLWQQAPAPRGMLGTSAHFVVGQDGQVIQCVYLRYAAQHAHVVNGRSVGVEHAVREPGEFGPNDPGMPPTPELYAASARLVAYLLRAAGLPVQKGTTIMGHAEADPQTTHTGCPDAGPWDWDRYLPLVQAAYDQLGTPPAIA
jgi:N-acetyl-anhydromuramyl-L-alanine amidase AmpD